MRRAVVRPGARATRSRAALVNTGRMSLANAYPPSPWAPEGARSVQNVAFDGTTRDAPASPSGTRFLGLWFGADAATLAAARRAGGAVPDRLPPRSMPAGPLAAPPRRRAPARVVLVRPDAYVAATLAGRRPTRSPRRCATRSASTSAPGWRRAERTDRGHEAPTPNIADPDGFYEAWVAAHEGLSDAESADLDARLVLLLANQVGDHAGAARLHRRGARARA